MNILHDGPSASPHSVNGVNQSAWTLARAQVERGDQVYFRVDSASEDQHRNARAMGIQFEPTSGILARVRPDVVHSHSVFIPRQAQLALATLRAGVPYVVQPHGGVAPQVLARGRAKKSAYSALLERPRFRRASAAIAVLEPERDEIQAFIGRMKPPVHVVPNPIAPPPDVGILPRTSCEDAVYLGRFDTHHKGLDRIASLAFRMPDITFGLYGSPDRTDLPPLPPNVRVHAPVYGEEKWRLLSSARIYVHLARWEAFGISIFEAMMVGTTPVVARGIHADNTVVDLGGIAIDPDAGGRNDWMIRALLERPIGDESASRMASDARALVDPERVAASIERSYLSAITQRAA